MLLTSIIGVSPSTALTFSGIYQQLSALLTVENWKYSVEFLRDSSNLVHLLGCERRYPKLATQEFERRNICRRCVLCEQNPKLSEFAWIEVCRKTWQSGGWCGYAKASKNHVRRIEIWQTIGSRAYFPHLHKSCI